MPRVWWSRHAGFQATGWVGWCSNSNSIGVRIPRDEWRRWRLWKFSRYSKSALANSMRVRHRFRLSSSVCSQFRSKRGCAAVEEQWAGRLNGPRRRAAGERRHGIVLRPAAKERPWTPAGGPPATSCAWRSLPGSKPSSTEDAANGPSANSRRSNLRPSTQPQPRPEHHTRRVSTRPGAVPWAEAIG